MSTISAILLPDKDGTVHLSVPEEWRAQRVRVKAELEPAESELESPPDPNLKGFGCLRGRIAMAPDFDEPLEDFRDYEG